MNWKSFTFVFFAIFGIVFSFSSADGALNAYMSVKGQKQGLIKGGVIQKGREGKILVIAASHEVSSPRNPTTGQVTDKRSHKPFTVTIEWDRALPNLYHALFTNELLTDVTIDFYTPNTIGTAGGTGQEVNYTTVKLTNATIASIHSRMPNNKMPEFARLKEYAEITFVYQKVEYTNKLTGGSASDGPFALLGATQSSNSPSCTLAALAWKGTRA